jgi:hypothetical protein
MECLLEQTIWLRGSEDNDQSGFVNSLRRTEVRFCPKFVNKREPNLSAPPVYRLDVIQLQGTLTWNRTATMEMRNEANRIVNRNVIFRCYSERSEYDSTSASD